MFIMPFICVLGLVGNAFILIVRHQRNQTSSTNVLLCALAISDSVKLLNDTLYFIDLVLLQTHPVAGNHMMGKLPEIADTHVMGKLP